MKENDAYEDDSYKAVIAILIACMAIVLITMAILVIVYAQTKSFATSSSHGYTVTVYNVNGTYYKRWTGIDKVSTVYGGSIQFFDDDGNAVILSPGCNAVVEWIGGSNE